MIIFIWLLYERLSQALRELGAEREMEVIEWTQQLNGRFCRYGRKLQVGRRWGASIA